MALVQGIKDNGLFLLTLSASSFGNRLKPEVLDELKSHLKTVSEDQTIRAVLLRSNGPTFCYGMDLALLKEANWEPKAIAESVKLYTEVLRFIYHLDKPVIGLLQGEVKAGGVGLISACDYIMGTEEASFEMAEVFFGLVPANVLPVLQGFRISPSLSRSLILTARKVSAAEAKAIGLLDEIVPNSTLEKRLKEFFKRLMFLSPTALKTVKRLTAELAGLNLEKLFLRTTEILIELLTSAEVQTGIEAFLNGQTPPWALSFKPSFPLAIKEDENELRQSN